jgi:signal transduction histidine kinase/DNA-binding response OmpR family regulator
LALGLFYFNLRGVVGEMGSAFATEYTLREKGRILTPLQREVGLCETLTRMPSLVAWVNNEDDPALRTAALRDLEAFRAQFREKSCFFVIRDSGNYYFRDETSGAKGDRPAYALSAQNPKDAWFYSTLREVDRLHLNVDKSVVRGQTMVFINTVVHSGTDRVAVAGTALNLEAFIKRLIQTQNPAVTPILVDPSGAIQAHRDPTLIDQNTLSKKDEDRSTIYRLIPQAQERQKLRETFAQLKSDPEKTATFPLTIEGQQRMASVAYLPEIDWFLVSLIDLSSAVKMSEFAPLMLVILSALGGLVVAISLLVNRTVLKPLGNLAALARSIASGDYSARAAQSGKDEIGELTRTFNSMLDRIEAHTGELEQRVDQRTSQLQAEVQERQKAEHAAKQASQAKSEFLANMSHEIRTPMNAILGFSEILSVKIQDPRHREYVNAIHSSGKSLLGLINDILDLSKVEAGKLRLEVSPIDPATILKEIELVFSGKVEEKGLAFSTEIQAGFPNAVLLDEIRVRQVLLNLVGNAIKFTEKGFVRISARAEQDPGHGLRLVFEVQDSGIGIPTSQLDSIFGAFEQQAGQSHAKFGGTGLGLTISKRLVELMGGTISVESAPGKGSLFRICLPQVEEAALALVHADESSAGAMGTLRFEPATILLAEDIRLNRDLIKGYLEDFQFEIIVAENGREAVELAQSKKPGLILMDIKMPVLDGIEASNLLKQDPETRSIPIVAVSASTMKSEEEKIGTVCDGFLRKPITRKELLVTLMRHLPHSTDAGPPAPVVDEALFCDGREVHDPEGLQQRLSRELFPMWEQTQEMLIVNQVIEFSERVIAIATTHRHAGLASWGDQLRNQAMLFDMAALELTLSRFPAFLSPQPGTIPPAK